MVNILLSDSSSILYYIRKITKEHLIQVTSPVCTKYTVTLNNSMSKTVTLFFYSKETYNSIIEQLLLQSIVDNTLGNYFGLLLTHVDSKSRELVINNFDILVDLSNSDEKSDKEFDSYFKQTCSIFLELYNTFVKKPKQLLIVDDVNTTLVSIQNSQLLFANAIDISLPSTEMHLSLTWFVFENENVIQLNSMLNSFYKADILYDLTIVSKDLHLIDNVLHNFCVIASTVDSSRCVENAEDVFKTLVANIAESANNLIEFVIQVQNKLTTSYFESYIKKCILIDYLPNLIDNYAINCRDVNNSGLSFRDSILAQIIRG